jgi:hypothetical protein
VGAPPSSIGKFGGELPEYISNIRYLLFIIDKSAGAGYLLDEMKIVR